MHRPRQTDRPSDRCPRDGCGRDPRSNGRGRAWLRRAHRRPGRNGFDRDATFSRVRFASRVPHDTDRPRYKSWLGDTGKRSKLGFSEITRTPFFGYGIDLRGTGSVRRRAAYTRNGGVRPSLPRRRRVDQNQCAASIAYRKLTSVSGAFPNRGRPTHEEFFSIPMRGEARRPISTRPVVAKDTLARSLASFDQSIACVVANETSHDNETHSSGACARSRISRGQQRA